DDLHSRVLAAGCPAAGVQRVRPRSPDAGLLGRGLSRRRGAGGVRVAALPSRHVGPGTRAARAAGGGGVDPAAAARQTFGQLMTRDRKRTRLNSSHLGISYAVFCLKKKKSWRNE